MSSASNRETEAPDGGVMAIAEQGLISDTQRLTAAAVVVARALGFEFANPSGRRALPAGPAELALVEALARPGAVDLEAVVADIAATYPGATADDLRSFVERLGEVGLLADEPAAPLPDPPLEAPDPEPVRVRGRGPLSIVMPLWLRVTTGGYEALDHDGRTRVLLSARELALLGLLSRPRRVGQVIKQQQERLGTVAFTDDEVERYLGQWTGSGLLRAATQREAHLLNRASGVTRDKGGMEDRLIEVVNADIDRRRAAERERERTTGTTRIDVYPVHDNNLQLPPLGVAMVMAYAMEYDGGRLQERYHFVPDWIAQIRDPSELTERPGVFLFSNYLWSHRNNLEVAAKLKAASPASIMIHGGPDTPKYEQDAREYFRDNPHVDVTVRTEGELTTAEVLDALGDVIGEHEPDLSVLASVQGIYYRDGDSVVRTDDRDRITDLDVVPSPYLTGLFDAYGEASISSVTIETNRGCPYGCTFCDWGSATASRIRKFDLDRVFAEIEWCARHHVTHVSFADANFGIWERDVDIAEKVAEMKAEHGYPKFCGTNYAKNTIKHQRKIVQAWHEAGILAWGILSLQSMDEETLDVVRRSNIKTEKYDSLAREFRNAGMPLYVDLMLGLPGSTPASFRNDLQGCIDREVFAKIHETTLLVNSPMNEPAYKEQFQIETARPGPVGKADLTVVSTSSFTRQERAEMLDLRRLHLIFENFGVLRHVARYLRHETGVREADFYEQLRAAGTDPSTWPMLAHASQTLPFNMGPPVSWRLWIDEIHRYAVTELGVADDDALATALAVQHALLPSVGRTFPVVLSLAHDYGAWHHDMLDAKDAGHDWTSVVRPLREYGPVEFTISDSDGICTRGMGFGIESAWMDSWELDSPIARPRTMATFASSAES